MTDDLNCHVSIKPDFAVSSEAWKRVVMQDLYASGMGADEYVLTARFEEALAEAKRQTAEGRK